MKSLTLRVWNEAIAKINRMGRNDNRIKSVKVNEEGFMELIGIANITVSGVPIYVDVKQKEKFKFYKKKRRRYYEI